MKQIKFSKRLAQQAELKAKEIGVSFNEYVRHLVVNDTNGYVEVATPEMEKDINEALRDRAEGRYTVLRNKEEVKKHFSKLLKNGK